MTTHHHQQVLQYIFIFSDTTTSHHPKFPNASIEHEAEACLEKVFTKQFEKLWLKSFEFNTKRFSLSDAPTCQPQHKQMREVRCCVLIFFISFSQLCSVKFGLQLHRRVGRSKSPKVAQKPSSWNWVTNWVLQVLQVLQEVGTWVLGYSRYSRYWILEVGSPGNCLFVVEVGRVAVAADPLWEQGGTLKHVTVSP